MSAPFFITGLPRSRTAWLALFLTTDTSLCEHDLLGRVDTFEAWRYIMEKPGVIRGDSDSALLPIYRDIAQLYPDARWLFVRRNPEEAWESLCKFSESGPWAGQMELNSEVKDKMIQAYDNTLPWLLVSPNVLTVNFEDLSQLSCLEQVWKHLLPGKPWNHWRAQLFSRMRVNVVQELHPMEPSPQIVERFKWV